MDQSDRVFAVGERESFDFRLREVDESLAAGDQENTAHALRLLVTHAERVIRRLSPVADPMPVFVIKGKDSLAPAAVMAYADLCVSAGLEDQASEVESAFLEITEWQRLHPEAVKTPDHKHVPVRPVRDGAAAAIERDAAEHAAELGESAEEYADE